MGNWGPGIFDDDVALDARILFEDSLSAGLNVYEAARHVLSEWKVDDGDIEDAAVIYLALAGLQLEHGTLDSTIREKAIMVIDSEIPLWRWEGSPPDRVEERRRILQEFRDQLERRRMA